MKDSITYTTDARRNVSLALRERIFKRDRFECVYCGWIATQIDHVIPTSYGGDNSEANLVACCRYCNGRLGDKVFYGFDEKAAYLREFEEDRLRWQRKQRLTCGDCGSPFRPSINGATNVLCPGCVIRDNAKPIPFGLREDGPTYDHSAATA